MTKLEIAKLAINIAAGLGVSKVTNDIISNNVNVDSTEDKVKVVIGSAVIGMVVGDMAKDNINGKIDAVVRFWQNRKSIKPSIETAENLETAA